MLELAVRAQSVMFASVFFISYVFDSLGEEVKAPEKQLGH